MRLQHLHPIRALVLVLLLAVAAGGVTASAASAKKKHKKKPESGAVYTETNDPAGNAVVKYKRNSKGGLQKKQTVATGGNGSTQSVGCGPGCPILDSAGAVDVTKNGRLVFVVNAGSDSISSFRETSKGLKAVSLNVPSGGDLPESLTASGGLLYVLNVDSNNISGFRYNSKGTLTPIAGSTAGLSAATNSARQIGFDNSGKVLVVTQLFANSIDTFVLKADGTPNAAAGHVPASALPFGFAFDPVNRLFVTSLKTPPPDPPGVPGNGDLSSYGLTGTGDVSAIDTKTTDGALPCWVAITPNGKYAYVVNTGAGVPATISRFKIANDGKLTLLGLTDPQVGEFARTDDAISRNGKFLYVLVPGVGPSPGPGHIDRYRVSGNGGLTFLGSTPSDLYVGVSGLDAR